VLGVTQKYNDTVIVNVVVILTIIAHLELEIAFNHTWTEVHTLREKIQSCKVIIMCSRLLINGHYACCVNVEYSIKHILLPYLSMLLVHII